ncbi:helix-turn-helix transcriptional regulator [Listeria monocytogenes]
MKLKELRKAKGLTQKELANKLGVHRTTITLIEKGINKPSVKVAKKLGEVLGVEWNIFFD